MRISLHRARVSGTAQVPTPAIRHRAYSLLRVTSAASLALLVAITALALRSGWVSEHIDIYRENIDAQSYQKVTIGSGSGRIFIWYITQWIVPPNKPATLGPWKHHYELYRYQPGSGRWKGPGGWFNTEFVYEHGSLDIFPNGIHTRNKVYGVRTPHWGVALPLAFPLALRAWVALRHRAKRKRLIAGLCVHCGYDLRGSAEKCPECGTPAPAHPVKMEPGESAVQHKRVEQEI